MEVLTSAGDENTDDGADLGDIMYPPKDDQKLKVMVQYILKNKKIPVVLPEHFRLPSVEMEYPRHLIPEEMMCQHCPGNVLLSDPILITQKAKILTSSRIIHGNSIMQIHYYYFLNFNLLWEIWYTFKNHLMFWKLYCEFC